MPRKGPAPKREIAPDTRYNSVLVAQYINKVMMDGKKSKAEKIVYGALDIIRERTGNDPLTVLRKATDNVRPVLEVRSRRVGGASYQVPVEVRPRRATSLAIRWIVNYARQRREKTMMERLAGELMDAANHVGASIKRKEDLHKMAEANKAFAHYRW
ncbi:30S ribosomal protein S7 [Candidatus Solincola tengchongensis]|uniref:30S ribosomal protein S7 n=1 Tax=Candidatus Solincola tengchongensis TaxID=2900693 RepID=UPI002579C8E6|nr:30S ribosomal protein S7 [Candidatus Solincola tengchongensis]